MKRCHLSSNIRGLPMCGLNEQCLIQIYRKFQCFKGRSVDCPEQINDSTAVPNVPVAGICSC